MTNSFTALVREVEAKKGYVYLIRNGELYKIGVTMNLERRMKELRPDEIIAVYEAFNVAGVERLLHSRYRNVRLPQTEYFRLSQEQVREVSSILNREHDCDAEFVSPWMQELASTRLSVLDGVATIFDAAGADSLFWAEHDDSSGKRQTVLDWLLNDPYAMNKLPATQATLEAAERMLVKDDAIAPIAKACSLEELRNATDRFLDDFSLLYCWLVDSKTLILYNRDGSSDAQPLDDLLKYLKNRLCVKKLSWKDETGKSGL